MLEKTRSYQRALFSTHLYLDRLYTPEHLWLAPTGGSETWRVGFAKFAVRLLGEIVDFGFEVSPEAEIRPDQVLGWVEGFKATADLLAVGQGRFLRSNPDLEEHLSLITSDAHQTGWLYEFRGRPASRCVDSEGYSRILDVGIDERLRGGRRS